MVCHGLGLAVMNLYTKFKVSVFTNYKDKNGKAKCRNWGGLVTQGHQQHNYLIEHI